MKLTLVTFRAFDKQLVEHFLDKSMEQIHIELKNKCDNYEVVSILQATGAQFQPLICLTKYK